MYPVNIQARSRERLPGAAARSAPELPGMARELRAVARDPDGCRLLETGASR